MPLTLGISAISVSSFGSNLNPPFVAFCKGGEDLYAALTPCGDEDG